MRHADQMTKFDGRKQKGVVILNRHIVNDFDPFIYRAGNDENAVPNAQPEAIEQPNTIMGPNPLAQQKRIVERRTSCRERQEPKRLTYANKGRPTQEEN